MKKQRNRIRKRGKPASQNAAPEEPSGPERQLANLATARISRVQFEGPLPPPAILSAYDKILTGGAERVFDFAEAEQKFQHQVAHRSLDEWSAATKQGRRCALVAVLAALAASVLLGYLGHQFAAATVGGLTVVGLATAFITGRKPPPDTSIPPPADRPDSDPPG